jgi:hypothetical protein
MYICIRYIVYTHTVYIEYLDMLSFQTEKGKRKPRQFSLIRLPVDRHANGLNGIAHLWLKTIN